MTSNTINDAVTIQGGERTLLANRYRIIKQLGQGGMGSVWLAGARRRSAKSKLPAWAEIMAGAGCVHVNPKLYLRFTFGV